MELLNWDWSTVGQSVVEAIDSDLAKPAVEAITTEGLDKAKKLWTRVKWPGVEQAYRERLLPLVSTTRLLGNPKPVNIDQLYTDIYVYDKLSALRRTSTLVDPRGDAYLATHWAQRKRARDVVATGDNLYLLGHPGAGKTTFLRYLAILCCKGVLGQVPVYLQLRDIARSYKPPKDKTSFEETQKKLHALIYESIVNEFDICSFPEPKRFVDELLKKGNALVLIDGLDEVPLVGGMRAAFIDSIRDLARRFPKIQLCVTCRIAASEYTFEHFTYAEIAHFTEEQQRTFIDKWYVENDEKGKRMREAWAAARSRPLRDLGRTPLLLALICLAFDDLHELPERYVDLYREALEALLKRWDTSRNIFRDPFYGGLNPHRREQLLQEIAATLFQRDKIAFSATDVKQVVEAWFARLPDGPVPDWKLSPVQELLDQIEAQHGLVIQREREVYSFAHLSIQEFLCAKSIAEGHSERQLDHMIQAHMSEPKWREVIVFCAGLLQDGTRLLEMMVAATRRHMNARDNLPSFLAQLNVQFMGDAKGEPHAAFKAGHSQDTAGKQVADTVGIRSPRILALEIARRLDKALWAGPTHALRRKAVMAAQMLADAEADPTSVFASLTKETSSLGAYLQAVSLVVDCACVATCSGREKIIGSLLVNARS